MRLASALLLAFMLTTGLTRASAQTPSTGNAALARNIKGAIDMERQYSGKKHAMTRGARRVLWNKLAAVGDTNGDHATYAIGFARGQAKHRTGTGKISAADMEIAVDEVRQVIPR